MEDGPMEEGPMARLAIRALTPAAALIGACAFNAEASGHELTVRRAAPVLVVHSRAPAPRVLVAPAPRIPRVYRGRYVIDSKTTWLAAPTPFTGADAPLIYSSHLFPGRRR